MFWFLLVDSDQERNPIGRPSTKVCVLPLAFVGLHRPTDVDDLTLGKEDQGYCNFSNFYQFLTPAAAIAKVTSDVNKCYGVLRF
jgi:hypothetical protein